MVAKVSFRRTSILSALAVFSLYFILIASLLSFLSLQSLAQIVSSPRTIHAIKMSVYSATVVVIISMVFSLPAGYALSRYSFWGRRFVDTLLELPLFVSPAALGAMILIFFNTSPGAWLQENTQQFIFTVSGIILAQFVATIGLSVRLTKSAFDEFPQRYEMVARSLGASSFQAFVTVVLPNCSRGIFAASILTWAKAMGEFGATITVAGTIAMRTETLPISIYMRLSRADIEGAVGSITLLIFISVLVLYLSRVITCKCQKKQS